MKKIISLIVVMATFLVLPGLVGAAGLAAFEIVQKNIVSEVGKTFDLDVDIAASSEKIDTARLGLSFDPTILKAESVVLGGVLDHSAPGNYIDNASGEIYWGGFVLNSSFEGTGTFAKITFSSKKEGKSLVSFSGNSKLISNGEEKINIGSLQSSSVTVSKSVPVKTETVESSNSSFFLKSPTHTNENQWYSKKDVQLEWAEVKGENLVEDYFYEFDQNSNTDPTQKYNGANLKKYFNDVQDGIHYFHIKGVLKDGSSTSVIHRKVLVDTTIPNIFEATVTEDQILKGESAYFTFGTTDESSGVANYQVSINDGEFKTESSPFEIKDLEPGTYFVRVAATDRAGNSQYFGKSIRVYPEDAELDRPEDYDVDEEVDAIINSRDEVSGKNMLDAKLVLFAGFVALFLIGLIYRIFTRKKRNVVTDNE
jgi:hypothetical protein